MNERNRLKGLLLEAYKISRKTGALCWSDTTVDFLLENGVIVPPCKVGDMVYQHQTIMWMDECDGCDHFRCGGFGDTHECARTRSPFKHPDCIEIEEVVATQRNILHWVHTENSAKPVFLTKEEAEAALAEGRKE